MKTLLSILIFCLASFPILYGQEGQLVLTKFGKNKEQTIREGKKIKVYRHDSYTKGTFSIIDSASIAIGEDTIQLSEIKGIEARTSGTITKGIILTTLGTALLSFGISEMKEANENNPSGTYTWTEPQGIIMVAIGAGMVTYGLGNLVGGMNYKNEKWTYSIR